MIKIDYNRIISIRVILLTSSISVLLINTLVYLNPSNHGWWNSPEFSWFNTLQFIFIAQLMIECISVFIILLMLKIYAEKFKLTEVKTNRSAIVKYELVFLPVPFLAFFIFNPFTQTVRFLYHDFPGLDWSVYMEEYFYSLELYLTYLPVNFLQAYSVLNYNLFIQKNRIDKSSDRELDKAFIEVYTSQGKTLINKIDIKYCIKKGRKYWIYTDSNSYNSHLTISKLEAILSPDKYVRINRATIVKIDAIKNYSFWENDKYILRLVDDHEFIMSRNRLRLIKKRLSSD